MSARVDVELPVIVADALVGAALDGVASGRASVDGVLAEGVPGRREELFDVREPTSPRD